uniref:Uncharacterized protein n=1 Tax=Pipistrellus kuhlii TaxID=59472 RepID=A0A7J7XUL0_PIPKU|nr:hypothetical protein mPipKuh1_010429 [Pipistrellus kuhlii]
MCWLCRPTSGSSRQKPRVVTGCDGRRAVGSATESEKAPGAQLPARARLGPPRPSGPEGWAEAWRPAWSSSHREPAGLTCQVLEPLAGILTIGVGPTPLKGPWVPLCPAATWIFTGLPARKPLSASF